MRPAVGGRPLAPRTYNHAVTDPLETRWPRHLGDDEPLTGVVGPLRDLTIDGRQWIVFEFIDRIQDPPKRDLIFETAGLMRRIREYPADWRALADADLFALCIGCSEPEF